MLTGPVVIGTALIGPVFIGAALIGAAFIGPVPALAGTSAAAGLRPRDGIRSVAS